MSEIDRRLIEKEQRRQQTEAERAEAAEAEIRMMVDRIPAEAQAALAVLERRGSDAGGAGLKTIDRSRYRFGFYKRRSEERAAWHLCQVGCSGRELWTNYWLLSDGTIATGDSLLYVYDFAESYATDVKYHETPGWQTGERSPTWAAIRSVYAELQKLSGRVSTADRR